MLIVKNIKKSANFSCHAYNDLGTIVASAYVTVRGKCVEWEYFI